MSSLPFLSPRATGTDVQSLVEEYRILPGSICPGAPPGLNRLGVLRWSLAGVQPRVVVILSPGFTGGAGLFRHIGPSIALQTEGQVAVWALDRRANFMEDHRGFEQGMAARDPHVPFTYYLGPEPAFDWRSVEHQNIPWMADWGLEVALADLRQVVWNARREWPHALVVLGGHSLGGMLAQAYAASEFNDGVWGEQELDGLVLIDGAVRGQACVEQYCRQGASSYALLDTGQCYWDDAGRALSPRVQIIAQVSAQAALLPEWQDRPSIIALAADRLGSGASCVVSMLAEHADSLPTNRAFFGLAVDGDSSPSEMARAHVGAPERVGHADSGSLLGWRSHLETGAPSDLDVYARIVCGAGGTDGIEWFSPIRLNADLDMLQNLDSRTVPSPFQSRAPRFVTRNSEVRLPVLGFVNTDHPGGSVASYEWYRSSIQSRRFTLDYGCGYAHMDPLTADINNNQFLEALIPWLRRETGVKG